MPTLRSGRAPLTGALVASLVFLPDLAAQQREPYPATLQFGTGLINIPVAWVSPANADVWVQTSGKVITHFVNPGQMNFATKWNTNASIDTHWLGRFSLGASAYSQNPEYGFFGQLVAVRPNQFGVHPGIAVGFRNLGKFKREDRLLVGHDIELRASDSTYTDVESPFARDFKTAPSFYGVATQEFNLASWGASVSVGYGNGLFSEDGGLGDNYNRKGQLAKGLFLGARAAGHPTPNTTVSLLVENDGWDWNAGVVGDWRGLTLGIYGTELEEGSKDLSKCPTPSFCRVYNYAKLNVSLGYNGNILDIARGVLLRTRITDLEREQQRLRLEIAARERRIRGLEVTLREAQAGELREIARRRSELEQQIQQERDAIRRAMDRLEQLEKGQRPPATPPATPPANPPANPPARPPQAAGFSPSSY